MNPENTNQEIDQQNPVFKVTPLSKYLAMFLFIAMPFIGGWIGYQYAPEKVVEVERVEVREMEVEENISGKENLKYIDQNNVFSFEYPDRLALVESDIAVELHHDVPYINYGDCDMIGDTDVTYERLTDFKLIFEVVSPKVEPPYIDGEISSGSTDGKWAYQGAEGCGVIEYYFDIDDQRTLVITRDAVQTLSGLANIEAEKAALAVPGVISRQENDKIFKQILLSLNIYDNGESI